MKATRSYGIAGVLPEGVSAGMTINVGSPTHSTRTAHLNDEKLLIVVGEATRSAMSPIPETGACGCSTGHANGSE